MKTISTILLLLFCLTIESSIAQSPGKIPYQAVARDNSGNPLVNQLISLRISIRNGNSGAGTSYYIKVNHRNAIETWSAAPVLFSNTTTYDFTTAQTQAYGGNMTDVGTPNSLPAVWAFYSGDISDAGSGMVGIQDGIIESQDYLEMENAVSGILTGYVTQDITGDGVVESADYIFMENNVASIIFVERP